jgi:hypothetical protein
MPTLPPQDPIPLPAPVGLLTFLSLLTFTLHAVPMTVALGGGFWAIAAARRAGDPALAALARRLAAGLPYWTAAAVTTGVAALLFLQVLYGPVFYAASVVIAWPWLAVVGLVLVGYYGYYFRAHRLEESPRAAAWVGGVAWLAFVGVAFVQVNEMTLMLRPDRIAALYAQSRTGALLNLGEPTLAARFLHLLSGALALGALWGAWLAGRLEGEARGAALAFAAEGFAWTVGLSAVSGLWFVAALPRPVLAGLMRSHAGQAGLLLALAGSAAAVWAVRRAVRRAAPGPRLLAGAGIALALLVVMVLLRHAVRVLTLGDAARLDAAQLAPQWGLVAAFLVLLVLGLATVGWMARAVARGGASRTG